MAGKWSHHGLVWPRRWTTWRDRSDEPAAWAAGIHGRPPDEGRSIYCECGQKLDDHIAEALAERWTIPENDAIWREYVYWRDYIEKKKSRQPIGPMRGTRTNTQR
jgi:hypothetical protein